MSTWSSEETVKFIEMYRHERCIWHPKDKQHKDKNKVNDSWNRIADGMGIPVLELKKKKETLMTAFRTHLRKKKNSIRSGAGVDEIYQPIWIYYDQMEAFLKGVYNCQSVVNTEDDVVHVENSEKESDDNCIQEIGPGSSQANILQLSQKENLSTNKVIIRMIKRRSNNLSELQDVNAKMSTAFTTLNEVLMKKDNNPSDDECVLYGKLIAIKLKEFPPLHRHELMHELDGLIIKKRHAMFSHLKNLQSSSPSTYSSIPSPQSSIPSTQKSTLDYLSTSNHESGDFRRQIIFTTDPTNDDFRKSQDIFVEASDTANVAEHLYVSLE